MPVGKELAKYKGAMTSVRVCETNCGDEIVEGTYTAKMSGEMSGTAVGTLTFTGSNQGGTLTDRGAGYLDSGSVESYKAHGTYWSGSQGNWETREAVIMGGQNLVVEGQITMSDGVFSLSGTVSELT